MLDNQLATKGVGACGQGMNSTINNLVRFDGCRKDDAERTLVVEYGLVAAMLRSWQGVSNVQQTTPV